MRFIFAFLILIFYTLSATASTMEYRYHDWSSTPTRDNYQAQALELALKKTVRTDGGFSIVRVKNQGYSAARVWREMESGKKINVLAGPWIRQSDIPAQQQQIAIEVPLLEGLLGYRNLIVRRADLATFSAIDAPEKLKALVAGLGRRWAEVPIYRANGYAVRDDGDLPALFDMLIGHRFDYLPLSVAESASALALRPGYADQLTIVPNMLIYYPFPTIFYVSAKEPKLADRLRRGLFLAVKDGTLAALFHQHFSVEIRRMRKETKHVFILNNPFVPAAIAYRQPILLRK